MAQRGAAAGGRFCASAPIVLMTDALLTPLRRSVPGLLRRHSLMTGDTQRPDVGHRALPAPLSDRHDVVGIPVSSAAKEPPIALAELGTVSPALRGPHALDPLPFRIEDPAEQPSVNAAEGTHAQVAAKDALTHERRAVPGRPVIDTGFTAEGPAPLRHLDAAGAAQRATVWTPRKRLGLDPSGLGTDAVSAHDGSHLLVFMMRVLATALGKEMGRCPRWQR